ncbi:hemolysin family protein [Candidatus Mycoplasma pogonae]
MDLSTIIIIIVIILCFIISAFFSALEMAYSSINRVDLENKLTPNSITTKLVKKHYDHFGRTLSTILLGNNLINIAASTSLSYLLSKTVFDGTLNIIISVVVMTPLIVIFGEMLPKIFARKYPVQYIKKVVILMEFFYWLFYPFTYPMSKLLKNPKITNTEQDLRSIIELGYKEGILDKKETVLALNSLDFDSTKLQKHFTRLKNVFYVEYDWDLKKVKEVFWETGYSRLPVKKNNRFIGILLLKNVWKMKKGSVEDYVVEVPTISSNILLSKVLDRLRSEKSQMAFVTKNTSSRTVIGIVTMEDLIEKLVGHIYDENDEEEEIYQINLNQVVVNADVKINKINQVVNFELPNPEMTIGEWLTFETEKKLTLSFKHNYQNFTFKVVENKRNSIPKIEITQK